MENGGAVACVVVFFFLILLFCAGTGWSNNKTYNQCKRSFRQSFDCNYCKHGDPYHEGVLDPVRKAAVQAQCLVQCKCPGNVYYYYPNAGECA